MKFIFTLISSLVVGLALAASGFSPLHEIRQIFKNKRKIFISMGLLAAGFVFVMAAIIIASVEGALQYDGQGFIMWSALFTLSVLMFSVGVLAMALAKVINPLSAATVDLPSSLLADFEKQFNLSHMVQQWMESRGSPPPPAPEAAPVENKFANIEREQEVYRH